MAKMDVSKDCALLVTKLLVADGLAITKMNVSEFALLPLSTLSSDTPA